MAYLTNKTINRLNLHGALLTLVELAFGLFAPIYLYDQGFSLPEVFLLLALLNGARIPLRLLTFPVVRIFGLRNALMIGTAGFCLSFPILGMVEGYDLYLAAYVTTFGLFCAMYWHCYHTFYCIAGESENRGRQLSVYFGLSLAISALMPLLSSVFIDLTSFQSYFLLPIPALIAMMFILSGCENPRPKRHSWSDGRKLMFNTGAKIHIFEAMAYFPLQVCWIFIVFQTMGKMVTFGAIVSLGILIQILYQLWLGKLIDNNRGLLVADLAGSLRVLQMVAKCIIPLNFTGIFAAEGVKAVASVHHALAQPTVMYNMGKKSSDPFWYWLFAETAFDIGTLIGAGSVALMLHLGYPLQSCILLALPGILGVWHITRRYYTGKI